MPVRQLHAWRKHALALPPDACCRAVLGRLGGEPPRPVFMLCAVAADAVKRGREAAEEAREEPGREVEGGGGGGVGEEEEEERQQQEEETLVALDTARRLAAALVHADADRATWRAGGGAAMKALRHLLRLAAVRAVAEVGSSKRKSEWREDVARVVCSYVVVAWRGLFCDAQYTCVQRAQLLKSVDVCLTAQLAYPDLFDGADLVAELVADGAAERNLAFLLCQVDGLVASAASAAVAGETASGGAALEAFLTGNNPRRLFRIAICMVLHATCLALHLCTSDSAASSNPAKRQKCAAPHYQVYAGVSVFPCVDALLVYPDSVCFSVATMMDSDEHLLTFLRGSLRVWSGLFEERVEKRCVSSAAVQASVAHWYPTAVLGTLSQALGGHAGACTDVIIDMFLHPETGVDAISYCLDLAKFVLREQQRAAGCRVVARAEAVVAAATEAAVVAAEDVGVSSWSSRNEEAERQAGMAVLVHLCERIVRSPSLMGMGLAPLVRALKQIEGGGGEMGEGGGALGSGGV